ncbi:endonuclease/exonuclease/phosphatase family protein, partial [Streptomyces sp. MZ04]
MDSMTAAAAGRQEDWAEGAEPGRRRLRSRGSAYVAALLLTGVTGLLGFRIADSDGFTPV